MFGISFHQYSWRLCLINKCSFPTLMILIVCILCFILTYSIEKSFSDISYKDHQWGICLNMHGLLGCYAILNGKYQHSEGSQVLHFPSQTVKEEWFVLNCLSPKWFFTPCSLVNSYWLECFHLQGRAVQGHTWPLRWLSWHNIPREFNLHQNCCQNLKSHKYVSPVYFNHLYFKCAYELLLSLV